MTVEQSYVDGVARISLSPSSLCEFIIASVYLPKLLIFISTKKTLARLPIEKNRSF
jgi:hypothetical protein